VKELARTPDAEIDVATSGAEGESLSNKTILAIFPMNAGVGFEALRETRSRMDVPCLFALDSGSESALA